MRYCISILLFAFIFFPSPNLWAQLHIQKSSSEIYQELEKLNTLGTVLYVAAHPDDENTRLLSWLVGEKKFRTAYVSLTRGDGGQNLIGSELGPYLGVVRTQELLAARAIDGAEQYFTRAYDFGFSKNPEETLQKWNQDSILKDLVNLIRTLQPDVMICRFPPNSLAGHGHHSASAILAHKAYLLAADENYTEVNLPAWKTSRLFWNTYQFSSGINTTSEDQLKLNIGTYNALLGESYGEIASRSRSQHKSQGFGSAATRGDSTEYFVQVAGDEVQSNLFENLPTSWNRIARSQNVQILIDRILAQYKLDQPAASLPLLLKLRKAIRFLEKSKEYDPLKNNWLKYKKEQLDHLIFQVAGIWTLVSLEAEKACPGDSVKALFEWIHRSDLPIQLHQVEVGSYSLARDIQSGNNQLFSQSQKVVLPQNLLYSRPYWLESEIKDNLFQPTQDSHGNVAEWNQENIAKIHFQIEDENFEVHVPLFFKSLDPVDGEHILPVKILPPVSMQWSSPFSVHPNGQSGRVQLQVTAHTDVEEGKLELKYPKGWQVKSIEDWTLPALKKGENYVFELEISNSSSLQVKDILEAQIVIQGKMYDLQLSEINYAHIPRQTVLTKSRLVMTSFDLHYTPQKIGYIVGAEEMVPHSLEQLGYEIVYIHASNYEDVNYEELSVIITGIRAYNMHSWLNDAYDKLMNYVAQGGHLVVQYNTNNFFGPLIAKMFPYELEITRDRVTVEEAPVIFLDADAKVLNSPNQITQKDFDGWVQERGVYFADTSSPEWKTVLSMSDPGEKPSEGSWVWAKHGKGMLTYTGLVFFRELPAGVAGAYRLFVNLLEANE